MGVGTCSSGEKKQNVLKAGRGAVAESLWRTEIWSQLVFILGEQDC